MSRQERNVSKEREGGGRSRDRHSSNRSTSQRRKKSRSGSRDRSHSHRSRERRKRSRSPSANSAHEYSSESKRLHRSSRSRGDSTARREGSTRDRTRAHESSRNALEVSPSRDERSNERERERGIKEESSAHPPLDAKAEAERKRKDRLERFRQLQAQVGAASGPMGARVEDASPAVVTPIEPPPPPPSAGAGISETGATDAASVPDTARPPLGDPPDPPQRLEGGEGSGALAQSEELADQPEHPSRPSSEGGLKPWQDDKLELDDDNPEDDDEISRKRTILRQTKLPVRVSAGSHINAAAGAEGESAQAADLQEEDALERYMRSVETQVKQLEAREVDAFLERGGVGAGMEASRVKTITLEEIAALTTNPPISVSLPHEGAAADSALVIDESGEAASSAAERSDAAGEVQVMSPVEHEPGDDDESFHAAFIEAMKKKETRDKRRVKKRKAKVRKAAAARASEQISEAGEKGEEESGSSEGSAEDDSYVAIEDASSTSTAIVLREERIFGDEEKDPLEVALEQEEEDASSTQQLSYFDLLEKHGTKKDLPPVDHSKIEYIEFRKNFYRQVREITIMKDHEVDVLRKTHGNIKVRGKHCPRPIKSFYQCGLPDKILKLIEKREYESPFPIQMQALPCLMTGRDVIGIAETGSGKTLAYALPMIRHILDQPPLRDGEGFIGLVMTPTRELCLQVASEIAKVCKVVQLTSVAVYGGTGVGEQLSRLKRKPHVVVATPGRLIDVLTISNGKVTNLRRVTFFVLDEADRMFDMGFEPQIAQVARNLRPDRQVAMFSATFPQHVEALARRILKKPIEIVIGEKGRTASRVQQYVEVRPESHKFFRLLQLLGEWYEHGQIIIFVSRQVEADSLFQKLLKYGYQALVLHGGQDQTDRDFTVQEFKDGEKQLLIATSIAARGLDVKAVVLVINYSVPDHLEDYVHRIGRTGRAGNVGVAYTFMTPDESSRADDMVRALRQSGQEVSPELERLAEEYRLMVNMGVQQPKQSSGFGGKGFRFTDSEKSRQQQERKSAKKEAGLDDSDDEREERFDEDALENAMAPSPAPGQAVAGSTGLAGAQMVGGIIQLQPTGMGGGTVDVSQIAAMAKQRADTISATSAVRGPIASSPADAAKLAALQVQQTLQTKGMSGAPGIVIQSGGQAIGPMGLPVGPGGRLPYYDPITKSVIDEFEINDYPEKSRHKLTHREVLMQVKEMTGTACQIKGHYTAPGHQPPLGQKKLYVEIVGPTPVAVQLAKNELKQIVEAVAMRSLNIDSRKLPPGARY